MATKKPTTGFRCSACRKALLIWLCRCPVCGEMNPFVEVDLKTIDPEELIPQAPDDGFGSEDGEDEDDEGDEDDVAGVGEHEDDVIVPLGKIDSTEPIRFSSGDIGLDHVLGGGLVPASVVALFGPAGIGKSTILTKVGVRVAQNYPVFYAAGEESAGRVARRVKRLKLLRSCPNAHKNLKVIENANETDVLAALIVEQRPLLCIVDSLASLASERTTGQPGGPSQVSYAAKLLIEAAHTTGTSILAIGHETKDGRMAGPSVARHDVDTLLALEHIELKPDGSVKRSDLQTGWLRLRADGKNRDGDTSAMSVYKMTEHGLVGAEELDDEAERSAADRRRNRKANGGSGTKGSRGDAPEDGVERKVRARARRSDRAVRTTRKRTGPQEDIARP